MLRFTVIFLLSFLKKKNPVMQMQAIAVSKLKNNIHTRAKKIADYLVSKGFPYVKVELEANVQPQDYSRRSECYECSGTGRIMCEECGGSGTIRKVCQTCNGEGATHNDNLTVMCPHCQNGYIREECHDCSDGFVDCGECNGRGYFDNDEWYEGYLDDFWDFFSERLDETLRLTEYAHVYNDGSVDSELTLTLHVNHLTKLPEIITAFADTCRHFGSCHTGNAGLHIALLTDKKYPSKTKLDPVKLTNFKRQVSKLLLGLVCLGSPNDKTRAFEFRDIQVSSTTKYSAIFTHDDTCIEYRLFDSCFDRPEYIIRYMEIINRTLHYYTDSPKRYLKLKDHVSLKRSSQILDKSYNGCYRRLAEVFHTDESVARLFRELAYLVRRRQRLWLGCIYICYALGSISKDELFSSIVAELKG